MEEAPSSTDHESLLRLFTRLEGNLRAYEDGAPIKDVAEQIGRSPTGLYKALARIRERLANCFRTRLNASAEGLS